jgi:hypothetical protein
MNARCTLPIQFLVPLLAAVLCTVLSSTGLPAQQQATTLADLAGRAGVIAVATALRSADPSPDESRIVFRSDELLRGAPGPEFAVSEPAGRCCGRALPAIAPGDRVLLFLQGTGPVLHPLGGDRAAMPADAELLVHVRALLAAPDDAAKTRLLLQALQSQQARVRADAELALPARPAFAALPADREALFAALADELRRGSTRAPALAAAAVRFCGEAALPPLLDLYLGTAADDQASALRRALLAAEPAARTNALLGQALGDDARRLRACELLQAAPDAAALPLLDALLRPGSTPRIALAAAEALLAAGAPASSLAGRAPEPVLELALRRRGAPPPLRTLRPRTRP